MKNFQNNQEQLHFYRMARYYNGHKTNREVAAHLGFSSRYIYELLRFPEKNPEKHRLLQDYIAQGMDKAHMKMKAGGKN